MDKKNKKNKSFTYLLPLLLNYIKENDNEFSKKICSNLNNTYCFMEVKGEEIPGIFLEFNLKEDDDIFKDIIKVIRNFDVFVNTIKYDSKTIIRLKNYKSPLYNAYLNFNLGNYSRFSEKEKGIILDFISKNAKKIYSKVGNILYKKDALRKELEKKLNISINKNLELSSAPNKLDETLIIN